MAECIDMTPTAIALEKMREEWTAPLRARVAELEEVARDGLAALTMFHGPAHPKVQRARAVLSKGLTSSTETP